VSSELPATELLARVYPAISTGDRATLEQLLAPGFVASVTEGMPVGGGTHEGAQAMIDDGWWAIGKRFAVKAEPREVIACADGRTLVLGRYRGRERATGHEVDAAFSHLWSSRNGQLTALIQITDTARWTPA
jgi:2-(1,2-epoxy-1,2-dihydrophenyl)acetyl-CoA isomerase